MTGQNIEIFKIDNTYPYTANVVWFRFVPMEADEVRAYQEKRSTRTLLAHMDGDFHQFDAPSAPHDYCKALYAMKDSDVGIVAQEVTNDIAGYRLPSPDYVSRNAYGEYRIAYSRMLTENRKAVYREEIEYAHKYDMKMLAAHRMQLANFSFPQDNPLYTLPFVEEHPELRCKARDGATCEFLSYAYRETQDFMIHAMLECAEHGFDGVMNIWTRGQHILFEEPVLQRFREKFGDTVDCRRLPATDPRLMEIRSDIMTEFYTRLRKALNDYATAHGTEPLKIYITCYLDLKSSKADSLDVERLAAEGLIDGIVQMKINVWEETDDVLGEDGLIDLEKYTQKAKTRLMYLYSRDVYEDMNLLANGIPEYREIADKYGIDFHTDIQWENMAPPPVYLNAVKKFYAAGAKSILLWDAYPCRVMCLPEWDCDSRFGNPEEVYKMPEDNDAYYTIHKVFSYNGQNLIYNHPNWRG